MSAAAPPTADAFEAGRVLFAGAVTFELGVAALEGLPEAGLPEIAFAGRSNVGKSSLINALTNRLNLARASTEPGRTRELNFFRLGEVLRLVDLPGYGYARAPKADIARWTALTRDYLRGRAPLKRVFLLIDARHGLKPHDEDVMKALDSAAANYQLVLTKGDKLKPTELVTRIAEVGEGARKHPAAHPDIIATSAQTDLGIAQLRATITALAQ